MVRLASPCQTDYAHLDPAYSIHAYKPSSCSHPCDLTTPAPCGCRSHSLRDGSQMNAGRCDTSPVFECRTPPPLSSPLIATRSRQCGDGAAPERRPPAPPADRPRCAWKERPIARVNRFRSTRLLRKVVPQLRFKKFPSCPALQVLFTSERIRLVQVSLVVN